MNGAKWKNQASALLKRAVDIRFVYLSFFRLFIIPSFFLHALYLHFGLSGTLIVLSYPCMYNVSVMDNLETWQKYIGPIPVMTVVELQPPLSAYPVPTSATAYPHIPEIPLLSLIDNCLAHPAYQWSSMLLL